MTPTLIETLKRDSDEAYRRAYDTMDPSAFKEFLSLNRTLAQQKLLAAKLEEHYQRCTECDAENGSLCIDALVLISTSGGIYER